MFYLAVPHTLCKCFEHIYICYRIFFIITGVRDFLVFLYCVTEHRIVMFSFVKGTMMILLCKITAGKNTHQIGGSIALIRICRLVCLKLHCITACI